MKNHRVHLASGQSRKLKIWRLKQWQKSGFCKWNGPGKVCIWIHHDLKIGTLSVFLEKKIVVQSIQSHLSKISRCNITNKGSNKFAYADTSKRLEIVFGIMFEN